MTKPDLILPSAPPPIAASTDMSRNACPDLFSRLPAEVRDMVYSHVGFPVGGYIWIDCPGYWCDDCSYVSHFTNDSNSKPPRTRHADNGVFQVRRKIAKLQFGCRRRNMEGMRACLAKPNNDDGDDSSDEEDVWENALSDWYLTEMSILGVNKETRAELLDLMFGRTEIDFDDVLTPRNPFRGPRVQWPYTVFWLCLLPSTLAHMTSITISSGQGPVEDYRCLSFIARHVINLRRLTLVWSYYYKDIDMANRLVETLEHVDMIAKKLQTLRIVVEGKNPLRKDQTFILERPKWGFTRSDIWWLVDGVRRRG